MNASGSRPAKAVTDIENTEFFHGSFMVLSNAAIGRIENYSELAEEFEALEKAMMAL